MIIHECEQGTPEWHLARTGVISASRVKDARATLKNGSPAAASLDYATEIAMERIIGYPLDDGFETYAMRRGRDLEALARDFYIRSNSAEVETVGFITTDCGFFGCSPDSLVGTDGGLEIKCPMGPSQLRKLFIDFDIQDYMDQIQTCMWITGRTWWDLVIYHPGLESKGIDIKTTRVTRDENYIKQMVSELEGFNQRIVTQYEQRIAA
jgi:hypothetical protein